LGHDAGMGDGCEGGREGKGRGAGAGAGGVEGLHEDGRAEAGEVEHPGDVLAVLGEGGVGLEPGIAMQGSTAGIDRGDCDGDVGEDGGFGRKKWEVLWKAGTRTEHRNIKRSAHCDINMSVSSSVM
jgi:hypothetical protein